MSFFDVAFLSLLGFFSFRGYFRGLIIEIYSFSIWIISICLAWSTRKTPLSYFQSIYDSSYLELISFVLIFLIIFILCRFLFKFFSLAFNPRFFLLNLMGFLVGFFKFYLFVIILYLIADEYIIEQAWWNLSSTSYYIIESSKIVGSIIGDIQMEDFKDFEIEPNQLL